MQLPKFKFNSFMWKENGKCTLSLVIENKRCVCASLGRSLCLKASIIDAAHASHARCLIGVLTLGA